MANWSFPSRAGGLGSDARKPQAFREDRPSAIAPAEASPSVPPHGGDRRSVPPAHPNDCKLSASLLPGSAGAGRTGSPSDDRAGGEGWEGSDPATPRGAPPSARSAAPWEDGTADATGITLTWDDDESRANLSPPSSAPEAPTTLSFLDAETHLFLAPDGDREGAAFGTGGLASSEGAAVSDRPESLAGGEIWVVAGDRASRETLTRQLQQKGYRPHAFLGQRAVLATLGAAARPLPEAIVLAAVLPDGTGYDLCRTLKQRDRLRDIPVLFVGAGRDPRERLQAFAAGGADYLLQPFYPEELSIRLANQLSIRRAQAAVQQLNSRLEERVRQRTAQLEAVGRRLLHMAAHDPLTHLPNRVYFTERLQQALERMQHRLDYHFAVLVLDCDRFKLVNNSLGHLAGNRLLVSVARRLARCLRSSDVLARLGGDEFAILLDDINNRHRAADFAREVLEVLRSPFQFEGREIFLNASIGVAIGAPDYRDPEHLLRDADTAMYRAKALGRGRYQLFDAEMHQRASLLLQLENDLRLALDRKELAVHYQPIVSVTTGRVSGFEALVRWNHPQRGPVSPEEFVPLAEESGTIVPIGFWVLEEACRQLRDWHDRGLVRRPLTLSVNLSPRQFAQLDLIEQIDRVLAEVGGFEHRLKLEITETAIVDNADLAAAVLQQLRDRHILLAIDDFGTGYSSLSYLHRFPANSLKVDRSFVSAKQESGSQDLDAIVGAIVALAHQLGMTVTAEGVETRQQFERLRALACEEAQGYFFSRPLDGATAATLLDRQFG